MLLGLLPLLATSRETGIFGNWLCISDSLRNIEFGVDAAGYGINPGKLVLCGLVLFETKVTLTRYRRGITLLPNSNGNIAG
jgi:hypothetical protein